MKELVKSVLLAIFAMLCGTVHADFDATGVWLDFSNASDVGDDPVVGFTHTYQNIAAGIDAIVTVTEVVHVAAPGVGSVPILDGAVPPTTAIWTNAEDINAGLENCNAICSNNRYMTFRVDFVQHGTTAPVTGNNVSIVVKDIDRPEILNFSGLTSYIRSADTRVTVSQSGDVYTFGATASSADITDQRNWVETKYTSANSIIITLGKDTSITTAARFAISFRAESWTSPVTTPVVLPTRTITYDANGATSGNVPLQTSGTGVLIIEVNSGNLQKNYQTFTSWNTAPDGSGLTLAAGITYQPSSDITVYAQYSAVSPASVPVMSAYGLAVLAGMLGLLGMSKKIK